MSKQFEHITIIIIELVIMKIVSQEILEISVKITDMIGISTGTVNMFIGITLIFSFLHFRQKQAIIIRPHFRRSVQFF